MRNLNLQIIPQRPSSVASSNYNFRRLYYTPLRETNFSTSNFFMLHHTYPPLLSSQKHPSLPKPKNLTLHRFGCPSKVHDHQGFSCIPTATCNDSARRKATGLGGVEESSGRNQSNLCLHISPKTTSFPPPKK